MADKKSTENDKGLGKDQVEPCIRHMDGVDTVSDAERQPECAVCLQSCIHPVELPCHHIFCFLCVKGVANQSKRCALCRHEIPVDFLNNPHLLNRDDLYRNVVFEDGYQWFYEGRNGWWQYDERTSADLEEKYKNGLKTFDILVAGFLYVVDLENMLQFRRTDPTRRRKIKRDLATIPKKGVAGIKLHVDTEGENRAGADGGEVAPDAGTDGNNSVMYNSGLGHQGDSQDRVPPAPSNTPQSPETGSPGRTSPLPEEALTATISNLSIHDSDSHVDMQHTRHLVGIDNNQMSGPLSGQERSSVLSELQSPSSSDSDWD